MTTELPKKIEKFTELKSWQKGHELVLLIYKLTTKFPQEEKYGLVSQMQRSAVSVTSNIAEGFGRRTSNDKQRFYDIATASIYELQNQMFIARDVYLINLEQFQKAFDLSEDTHRLLVSWIRGLPS